MRLLGILVSVKFQFAHYVDADNSIKETSKDRRPQNLTKAIHEYILQRGKLAKKKFFGGGTQIKSLNQWIFFLLKK